MSVSFAVYIRKPGVKHVKHIGIIRTNDSASAPARLYSDYAGVDESRLENLVSKAVRSPLIEHKDGDCVVWSVPVVSSISRSC